MSPNFYKPRRIKSAASLQHDSNKSTPWDDESAEGDADGKPTMDAPILTLPNGITVRPVRRTDAASIQRILNDGQITLFYNDSTYPQPFSLWRAHKLIDDISEEKNWRRPNPSKTVEQQSSDDLYQQAVEALADLNLDRRLSKEPWQHSANSESSKKEKTSPIPNRYAIAHDDTFIGLIELEFENPEKVYDEDSDSHEGSDPAFLHIGDLCYFLDKEYRNRGIMTSVLREFTAWGWRTFGHLERIEASVFSTWNPPSCKVLQKCGFERGAYYKGCVRKNGSFGDIEIYAALRPGGQVEAGP